MWVKKDAKELKIIERDWDWWAYFWRITHRQTLKGIEKWDELVVRFLIYGRVNGKFSSRCRARLQPCKLKVER
ncbi:MAG: hypothetical protein ACPL28_08550 [bacterium]